MKYKGEGRTRFGRFAAVAVPSAVVSAGLGVAIVQGMIGATLSSANGFNLETAHLQADGMAVTAGGTNDGSNKEVVFARVDTAKLQGMCIGATQALPTGLAGFGLTNLGVDIKSGGDVSLPSVDMNAAQLDAGTAWDTAAHKAAGVKTEAGGYLKTSISDAAIGVAQSASDERYSNSDNPVTTSPGADGELGTADDVVSGGFSGPKLNTSDNKNYSGSSFALVGSDADLYGVQATSYSLVLHGLDLSSLSLSPTKNKATAADTCSSYDNSVLPN